MDNQINEKSVLLHGYFNKNLGDDLFFDILFNRYNDIIFYVYGVKRNILIYKKYKNVRLLFQPNSKFLKLLFRIFNKDFDLYNYRKEFSKRKYRNISAIVTIGGSIFMESFAKRKQFSKMKEDFSIFPNIKQFLLGCNFGPFETEKYFDTKKELIKQFEDVYFRDTYSYTLFKDLNNVRYGSDIVLKHFSSNIKTKDNTVGFALTPYRNANKFEMEDYKRKCAELVITAIKKNKKVTLFSFCGPEGDQKLIKDILKRVKEKSLNNRVKTVTYNGNLKEFLNIFLSQEYIFAGRYHAFILCLKNKISVIPIIYNVKQENLITDIKYSGKVINIGDLHNLDIESLFMNSCEYKLDYNNDEPFEKLDLALLGRNTYGK